ncbi:MAG TPA: hypothetical protein VM123_17360 [archaeon]|nr:hypothetical protein [archaeon]
MKNLIKEIIAIEADALARGYGIKNNKRVRAIMERTAVDYYGRPLPNDADARDPLENGLRFIPSFEEALSYLPPEEALAAFESIDPLLLSRRTYLIEYFADPSTPFYTLKELANLCEKFRTHLEYNREFLIQTGFPKTSFEESKWLDYYLSYLYFVKLPVFIQTDRSPMHQKVVELDGLAEIDEEENFVCKYFWVDRCPLSGTLHWGKNGPSLGRQKGSYVTLNPLRFCSYEDAHLIDGLNEGIARRLEESRAKFFKPKIDLIDTLLNCIRFPSYHKDIWEKSLKILSEAFTQEEMRFYLDVDAIFDKMGIGSYLSGLYSRPLTGMNP